MLEIGRRMGDCLGRQIWFLAKANSQCGSRLEEVTRFVLVCLLPTGRPAWPVLRGVSQRLEIKGLKFFRFSDHRFFLPVGVVRCD